MSGVLCLEYSVVDGSSVLRSSAYCIVLVYAGALAIFVRLPSFNNEVQQFLNVEGVVAKRYDMASRYQNRPSIPFN